MTFNLSTIDWTAISAMAALLAAFIAWWQLGGVKKSLTYNSLMAVLEMEAEMHRRKEKLDDINTKVQLKSSEAGEMGLNAEIADIYEQERKCALEGYLNAIDRLAYCIKKKILKDRDWKKEYEDLFAETIRNNESLFGAGTYYTNILDIHNQWKR